MSSVRAFLAIPLPWQLQESIRVIQTELQASIAAARWTRAENLHLTLHFFAKIDLDINRVTAGRTALRGCDNRCRRRTVSIDGNACRVRGELVAAIRFHLYRP